MAPASAAHVGLTGGDWIPTAALSWVALVGALFARGAVNPSAHARQSKRLVAVTVAARIREVVESTPFPVSGQEVAHIAVSGCVATRPADAQDEAGPMRATGVALCSAKRRWQEPPGGRRGAGGRR